MTRHQYGVPGLVTQTSICEGSSGDLAKRRLFSQVIIYNPDYKLSNQSNKVIVKELNYKFHLLFSVFIRIVIRQTKPDPLGLHERFFENSTYIQDITCLTLI